MTKNKSTEKSPSSLVDPKNINPKYYKAHDAYEPIRIIEALFRDDALLAMAFKHMARTTVGKKENSYAQDVTKARWYLTRALQDCGAEPKD